MSDLTFHFHPIWTQKHMVPDTLCMVKVAQKLPQRCWDWTNSQKALSVFDRNSPQHYKLTWTRPPSVKRPLFLFHLCPFNTEHKYLTNLLPHKRINEFKHPANTIGPPLLMLQFWISWLSFSFFPQNYSPCLLAFSTIAKAKSKRT